jgi:putative ABC transport system permease protein
VPFGQQKVAAFLVRTKTADPLSQAPTLRRAITEARSDFRVTFAASQKEMLENDTIRERLLAVLAMFFATVSLCLAGVGLFGVLDYSVLQRRREIGIRLAIGAPVKNVLMVVTSAIAKSVLLGSGLGVLLGFAAARWIRSLLYGVEPTDTQTLALAIAVILAGALLAVSGPAIRAIRLDPVQTLRQE